MQEEDRTKEIKGRPEGPAQKRAVEKERPRENEPEEKTAIASLPQGSGENEKTRAVGRPAERHDGEEAAEEKTATVKTSEQPPSDEKTRAVERPGSYPEAYQMADTRISEEEKTVMAGRMEAGLEEEKVRVSRDVGKKVPSRPRRAGYLLGIRGSVFGKKFRLSHDRTRIGRDKDLNEISIPSDGYVGRTHATITVREGEYVVSDKRSRNRTYVNQFKLSETDEVVLRPKDEIETGRTIFRFVEEGDWDFSPPRRAGPLSLRLRCPVFLGVAFLVVLFSLSATLKNWKRIRVISQVPRELKIAEKVWKGGDLTAGKEVSEELTLSPTPAISNLDRKGNVELVLAQQDRGLSALDGGSKEAIWTCEYITLSQGSSPTLADVNGDGLADVAVSTTDSRIVVLDGRNGLEIFKSGFLGGTLSATPAVTGLKGGGGLLVTTSEEGGVHAVCPIGTRKEPQTDRIDEKILSSPTIADLDADGSPEILVGTDSGRLYIYDGATMGKTGFLDVSMRLAELRLQEETQQIRAAAAVGNVGGGPSPEVVLATRQGKVIAVEASTLNILWYYEFGPSKRALPQRHSAPVLCDLDGDQSLEVVVTSNTGDVCALKSPESGKRAEKLWSYSTGEANRLVATPALVDFDKDGFFDVVAAGEDGRVFLIDGRPQVENRLLWSSEEGVAITASPVIGDVDGNGYLDILCLNDQGRVTIYETNSRTFRHTIGSAMLYHLPSHINSYSYDRLEAGPYRARLMAALTVLFLTVSGVLMLWVRRKRKIEA